MKIQYTQAIREEAVQALSEIISYPSVLDQPVNAMPFGIEIQKCLEATLKLCERYGFKTFIDPNGFYGYAEIGDGERMFGILCHLDVVQIVDEAEWSYPPFELSVSNDALFGRGTQDDKGPTIAALFAVIALLRAGYTPKHRIRFIFGTDEETLWRCMAAYKNNEEHPDFGFAPDSSFPLTFAEKGLLQFDLFGEGVQDFDFEYLAPYNVVPGNVVYSGSEQEVLLAVLKKLNFDYLVKADNLIVEGKSVHAKDAPLGDNALIKTLMGLNKLYPNPALSFIENYIGNDARGMKLFGVIQDEMSGPLTLNLAQAQLSKEGVRFGFDMRIPVTANKLKLVERLSEVANKYGLLYREVDFLDNLYVPLDSELVEILLNTYRELSGDLSEPISSGGATYARAFKNFVAFGARLPDELETEHQVNEHMSIDNFYQALEIYAHAIKALAFN